jgi:hypothetical protein
VTADQPERPGLRVVRGDPTAEELAALVTVLVTRSGETAEPARGRSAWNDPARLVRRPLGHGPGGWRSSALPS